MSSASEFPTTLRPDPDELCVGTLFGDWTEAARWPETPAATLRAAVEASVLEALRQGPCFVAFSGGVDSSAVLAIAVAVARREGLPLPVPVTIELPGVAEAGETDWQRGVLASLDLEEGTWERIDARPYLDFLGDKAARVHRAIGAVSPITLGSMVPVLEVVGSGTLLTGSGGDELMSAEAVRLSSALRSGLRPTRRGWVALASADIPAWAMAGRIRWGSELRSLPWLRRDVRRRLIAREVAESRVVVRGYDERLRRLWRHRELQSARASSRTVAALFGATVMEPFFEAAAYAAAAQEYGDRFAGSRAAVVHALAGDLLPAEVVRRSTKAVFDGGYLGPQTTAWLEGWDGRAGVDGDRIDGSALRALVMRDDAPYGALMPVLAAWLETEGSGASR